MRRYLSFLLCLLLLLLPAFSVYAVETPANNEGGECLHIAGGETKTYDTLEQALSVATAGTIQMLADASTGTVVLKPSVILDLNGHTVTADICVAMSGASVLDGGEACNGGGLLKIPKGNLTLLENSNNIVPVWNGTNGYIFTKVTFRQMAKAEENGVAQYIFLPVMSNDAAALLGNGGQDNDLKVKISLTWNNGQSCQFYTYSDDLVEQVFDGTNQWAFYARIAGIADITDMVANAVVVTDTGAQATNVSIPIVAG